MELVLVIIDGFPSKIGLRIFQQGGPRVRPHQGRRPPEEALLGKPQRTLSPTPNPERTGGFCGVGVADLLLRPAIEHLYPCVWVCLHLLLWSLRQGYIL